MTVSDSAGTASAYRVKNAFVEFNQADSDKEFNQGRRDTSPTDGDKPAFPGTPSPFLHPSQNGGQVPPLFFDSGDMRGLPPAYDCQMAAFDCSMVDGQYYGGYDVAGDGYGEVFDPSFSLYMQQGWIAAGFDEMGAGQIPGGGMLPEQMLAQSGVLQLSGLGPEHQLLADVASSEPAAEGPTVVEPAAPAEAPEETTAASAPGSETASARSGRRGAPRADRAADREAPTPRAAAAKPEASPPETASARTQSEEAGSGTAAPGTCTTVMLRNIPNKYTREMLVDQLNREFRGRFDFMYLPIDFKNKCNVGYGFINFRTAEACEDFVRQFHGIDVRKCLPGLKSNKVVEVTPARVQGLSENVRRLRNSPVMNQLVDHPEWMPMIFSDHGQELFPKPDQPLPPVKPRGRGQASSHSR